MSATDAAVSPSTPSWRYDPAERKRSVRKGREKGCWVYIARDELVAAGFDPSAEPPYYRAHGFQRSRNAHTVIVSLYREA